MDLHLTLEPSPGGGGKREALERQLRDAVRSGRLQPGARLPPTRSLAADLGVSRGVVVEAYEQLVAEGWLVSRRGAGTTVAHPGSDANFRHAQNGVRPTTPAGSDLEARDLPKVDLRTGRPDLAAFPRKAWLSAYARALRSLPDADLGYGDPAGHLSLREALVVQLGRSRGVMAGSDQVVVTGGSAPGLAVALRAARARRVAIEDPGWRGQRNAVRQAGAEEVLVPVDAHGLVVDALPDDVDVVCVTPAHQFPLGVVLAPERRAALVAWARAHDALVIEDDYDAEYRYDRDPVGALQGLAPDRVVYAGSASKTLAPALRLGWLVAPPWFAERLAAEKDRADRGTPTLEQAALADLVARGDLDRHLRRTRLRYRARRDALVAALHEHAPAVRVGGAAAGLHVIAWLPDGVDEAAAAAHARAAGVEVDRLHRHITVGAPRPAALLLGYAAETEQALARAVAAIAPAVRGEP
jgi:GntR family transcriptional regulator/MocR family aminotransferase